MKRILFSLVCILTCNAFNAQSQGLYGYLGCYSNASPANYNAGVSFYSAIWRLTPIPIAGFQIGLPSTWVTPDNSDNTTTPLCPVGTYARDNWTSTTYESTFQTIEGGPGYWQLSQFLYGPPKFMMNSTADCYTTEVATPGWPFFHSGTPLPDNALGIAQVTNRILMPPDGMTFSGEPNGELLGTAFMALPLTSPKPGTTPVGGLSWTLFLNSSNFKGPLAFFVPDAWARISKNYAFDTGRGLDARPFRSTTTPDPSMEINTVPYYTRTISSGTYTRIPVIQFPVDTGGKSILVTDYQVYSKDAIFNDILAWRAGGSIPAGAFKLTASHMMKLNAKLIDYKVMNKKAPDINTLAVPTVFDDYSFGLKWSTFPQTGGLAKFPEYFQEISNENLSIDVSQVPSSTGLASKQFQLPFPSPGYVAPMAGAWSSPGPAAGPYKTKLADGTTITYYWYKFIDQPVFKQFNWTQQQKDSLQGLIEQMHAQWSITQDYMAPPMKGALVTFDTALLVTPPAGFTIGYVPIVTKQEIEQASGINEPGQVAHALSIYPNPSDGNYIIHMSPGGAQKDYLLTDISGRQIRSVSIKPGITAVDITAYSPGVYFLAPADANGAIYKLVKY